MEITDVPIDQLKPALYNPRTISQHEFESLQRSIDTFGFVEPVVVNKRNGVICGGHMRVNAARELKLETVPVCYVDLDEAHEKALNIALNKIAGEFDTDLLAELLHDLDDDVIDLTGFTEDEIEGLQDGYIEHDEDGPKADEPKVKKYSIDELRRELNTFETTKGLHDNGFVVWLESRQ